MHELVLPTAKTGG